MSETRFSAKDHSWLVCAYRESPYLETCIRSLLEQQVKSTVRIFTATPNEHISATARKYGLEVTVNPNPPGIGTDWNFALEHGETELLTLAHQDDVYEPEYTAEMLKRMNRARNPILFASNYAEIRKDRKVTNNHLLRIKHLLILPLRMFPGWKWARRLSLAFGCAICCPSVTYRKSVMKEYAFSEHFRCDLDWDMEERLSRRRGSFVYSSRPLMGHRIHEESATTALIGESVRNREDYEIMRRFWPEKIARRLSKAYAASEKSNQVQ